MLVIEHLTKAFGGLVAVDDVSLQVNQGEIVGLIGPNGAGKTTLIEVVSGFQHPTRGRIWLKGERIDSLKPHLVCQKGIARSFQGAECLQSFTPYETILLSAQFSLPKPSQEAARKRTEGILETVGLAAKARQPINCCNLPEKKAMEIGRVVALKPQMVLFDEVMAGLSQLEAEAMVSLIRRLRQEEGMAFVMVEHRMEIMMEIADRIVALNFGKKIAEGTPQEIAANREVIESYMGEELFVA